MIDCHVFILFTSDIESSLLLSLPFSSGAQVVQHAKPYILMQELGRQAEKLGTDPRSIPDYKVLWKAVAPADKPEINL